MANQYQLLMCLFSYVLLTIANKTDHGNSMTKIDLYIGGLFGVNVKNGSWSTAGVIPALEMALEHVNSDPAILVNYQLKYVWNDSRVCSQCRSRVIKLFIFFLKSKQIISVSIYASYRNENKIQRRKKESNETETFWLLSVV